jgi:hypothetical protein
MKRLTPTCGEHAFGREASMKDGGEKKLILGYVSAYLKQPLRTLSEVEGATAPASPGFAMLDSKSSPYERRAPVERRDRDLSKKRRRKEDSVQ